MRCPARLSAWFGVGMVAAVLVTLGGPRRGTTEAGSCATSLQMETDCPLRDLAPAPPDPSRARSKLPSVLIELFDEFARDPERGRAFMRERLQPQQFVGDSVRVILSRDDLPSGKLPSDIRQLLGVTVEAESASLLQVLVPIPSLAQLADQLAGVEFINLHIPPEALTISEGVALTGASAYHQVGITGNGVKVAIIDLEFGGIQAAINAGEFGNPHKIDPNCTKNYITNTSGIAAVDTGGNHGVSVAHAVHNMAPGASLCLKLVSTAVHLENAKNDAVVEGVRVINHSVGWLLGSFYDGTGAVDGIAASAFDNNVLWVNAAGNDAKHHWQGGWTDGDGDTLLNFSGADECNEVSLATGTQYRFLMNWNAYPKDAEDYDLFLYRSATHEQVASSTGLQTGTQPPEEWIAYTPPTSENYCFEIKRFNAPSAPEIEILVWNADVEHGVPSSSLPNPANSPKVMAVAAIDRSNWGTGPQEPFSSQGPTNNSKFAIARVEPAISGPDRTLDYDGTRPAGTSIASPHVAGCAALIKAANPGFTAAQVRTKLESEAVDMAPPGKDNIFGWGRLTCTIPVGGIAEPPDVAQAPAGESASSDASSPPYGALVGGLVGAAVALGAGAWYARRRWLR